MAEKRQGNSKKSPINKFGNLFENRRFKRVPFSKYQLLFFALVFAAIGGYIIWSISRASGTTANIFISPTGTNCTRFATPISYPGPNQSCSPSSLLAACQLAQAGDTIMIENGTYSGSTLDGCIGKTGTITFTTEPGQACTYSAATPFASLPAVNTDTSCPVTFTSELSLRGSQTGATVQNLAFNGIYFSDIYIRYANHISLDHSQGHFWFIRGSDHVSITNGDWGNEFDATCATIGSMGSGLPPSTNIVISGNIFHDLRRDTTPTSHADGLFVQESDGVLISGNVFYRTDIEPLYVNSIFNGAVKNITIVNNVVHSTTDHKSGVIDGAVSTGNTQAISLGNNTLTNATVAFNTVSGGIHRQESGGPTTNLKVYGNVARFFVENDAIGCAPAGTFDYNVWYESGAVKCGTHDATTGSVPFISQDVMPDELTIGNLTPPTGSTPINFVPSAWCSANSGICPVRDFTGASRPQGSAYDAGAYEVSSGSPSDTAAPSTPANLVASGVTSNSISVSWTASTDNVGVVGYTLYKNGVSQGTTTSNSYPFSSLSCGTSYNLAVDAYDAAGNHSSQASLSTLTGACSDSTPPTVSITAPISGVTVTGSSVMLSANASDNVSVSGVQFKLDGNNLGVEVTSSPYSTLFDSTKVTNGAHSLGAVARDATGNTSSDNISVTVQNGDTLPPTTPTNLNASAAAYNRVNLTWTAATDNVGVTTYWLVRNGVTMAQLGAVTSYVDTTVNANTNYSYQVIAGDGAGNTSGLSNTSSVVTPVAPDTTPPTAPAALSASAISSSQINLVWNASTDNVGVTGYDVYRGSSKIASVATTSFGDTGLIASTSYSYHIIARDGASNSSPSSTTVTATTQAQPTTTGNLAGVVYSSRGGSLPRATVSLNVNGKKVNTSTSSNGSYSISRLPAKGYSVRYSAYRYVSQYQNVTITSGQTTIKNVTLRHR